MQALVQALGAQVGSATVNVLSLQLELQTALAEIAAFTERNSELSKRILNDEERFKAISGDRDRWRREAERLTRAPRKRKTPS